MGRKPTKNHHLPRRVRARVRGAKIWYYYDAGGKPRKEVPLGCDYAVAIKKWSELEIDSEPIHSAIITFRYVAERYTREVIPTKAANTQRDNHKELIWLYKFFDNPPAPLEKIEPINIRQYLDWRGIIRANREKALFSHIWNKAREWGYTSLTNPCVGGSIPPLATNKTICYVIILFNLFRKKTLCSAIIFKSATKHCQSEANL